MACHTPSPYPTGAQTVVNALLCLLCFTAAAPLNDEPIVLVLGDSVSAGQGTLIRQSDIPDDPLGSSTTFEGVDYRFSGAGFCSRDPNNSPGGLIAAEKGMPLVNMGCAAALFQGIIDQWDYARLRYDLENAIILFNVGGNDSRELANLNDPTEYLRCPTSIGALPWQEYDIDSLFDWADLESRMEAVVSTIANNAPASATIRAVGYPLFYRPLFNFFCWSLEPCAKRSDSVTVRMNQVLASLTSKYNSATGPTMEFVSFDDLLPSASCTFRKLDIHGFQFDGLSLSGATFHPTQRGYRQMYDRLSETL